MYASTKMIPTLHSQSMCEKLQVEERVLEALIKSIWLSQKSFVLHSASKSDIREAVDLRKTFGSICHPLLLAKLKAYGFTDNTLEVVTVYF